MRIRLILVLLLLSQIGRSQESDINAYEYVIIPMQFDFQSEPNEYQLNILSRVLLKSEGFKVFMDTEKRPLEYRGTSCEPLFLDVEDTSTFLKTELIIRLKDCYKNVVFESEVGSTRIKEFKEAYQLALKNAFKSLEKEDYRFNNKSVSTEPENVNVETTQILDKVQSDGYPNKEVYKFGGSTYWLVKKNNKDYRLITSEERYDYAELINADKGTFIFNSKTINGAAFFDDDGNILVEYMDEDLNEIQNMVFRKVDQ